MKLLIMQYLFTHNKSFAIHAIYHCLYTISGYHRKEMSANQLYERKLRSRPRASQQSFASVYRVYSVSTYNILMCICEVIKKTT
jgi:hypothetical protein